MKKVFIFAVIFFIVSLPISIFTYSLTKTRTIPPTILKVEFSQIKDNDHFVSLDKESINNLKEAISTKNIYENQNQIIDIFERERSKYIELLSIVAIILTVFSLFSIVTGFFDKSENEKIKDDLLKTKKEYSNELKKLKWRNAIADINDMILKTQQYSNFIFPDNTIVNSLDQYEKFIFQGFSNMMDSIDIEMLKDQMNFQCFSLAVFNYMNAIMQYINFRYHIITIPINLNINSFGKIIMQILSKKLNKQQYDELKNQFSNLTNNTIIWGAY